MANPKAITRRIKERYPYHVVLPIKGQPDPTTMSKSTWGDFGRVNEWPNLSNRWCFSSEELRREFINLYGGSIPV